jgi:hypothetical protein
MGYYFFDRARVRQVAVEFAQLASDRRKATFWIFNYKKII